MLCPPIPPMTRLVRDDANARNACKSSTRHPGNAPASACHASLMHSHELCRAACRAFRELDGIEHEVLGRLLVSFANPAKHYDSTQGMPSRPSGNGPLSNRISGGGSFEGNRGRFGSMPPGELSPTNQASPCPSPGGSETMSTASPFIDCSLITAEAACYSMLSARLAPCTVRVSGSEHVSVVQRMM